MIDNYKFTNVNITRKGRFEINNAFIEMQYDNVVLINVDCKTKYPKIFAYSSADSISIITSETIPVESVSSFMTTIQFPEFPGWEIHSYTEERYSIYLTLKKPVQDIVKKSIKVTPEYLFDKIIKIVASPHTTITIHDQERAAKILLAFHTYLGAYEQDQEDEDYPWVNLDGNFMFWYYLVNKFGEEWVNEIDKN